MSDYFGSKEAARRVERAGRVAERELLKGLDFTETQTGLPQYGATGAEANQQMADMLLGVNSPESAQAFRRFQDSSGYQFRQNEGINAIEAGAAARGMRNSGAALRELGSFNQNLASQEFGNYLGQIGGLSQLGLTADTTRSKTANNVFAGTAQALSNAEVNSAKLRAEGQSSLVSGIFGGLGGGEDDGGGGGNPVGNFFSKGMKAFGF